ncbi:MAG: hypothetical protein H6742_05075 [Alphaproteobacteria bacterium]|nr:hypothetical protein [Alphaproteobacteria bacterium]
MTSLLLLATLTGCMSQPIDAPFSAVIQAPESVSLAWDDSANGQFDGIGALILADFLVYDSEQGVPLENIAVEVTSGGSGVYLLPPEALKLVDYPEMPEGASMSDCEDENGNFDNETNEWCAWHYDTISGNYYSFSSDFADAGGYGPTYVQSGTDNRGLLRVYVYVDALPAVEDSFADISIVGSIGHASDFFEVGPGENN